MNKMPPQTMAQVDLSEAKNLIPEARDKGRRWYGALRQLQFAGLQHQSGEGCRTAEDL